MSNFVIRDPFVPGLSRFALSVMGKKAYHYENKDEALDLFMQEIRKDETDSAY